MHYVLLKKVFSWKVFLGKFIKKDFTLWKIFITDVMWLLPFTILLLYISLDGMEVCFIKVHFMLCFKYFRSSRHFSRGIYSEDIKLVGYSMKITIFMRCVVSVRQKLYFVKAYLSRNIILKYIIFLLLRQIFFCIKISVCPFRWQFISFSECYNFISRIVIFQSFLSIWISIF